MNNLKTVKTIESALVHGGAPTGNAVVAPKGGVTFRNVKSYSQPELEGLFGKRGADIIGKIGGEVITF